MAKRKSGIADYGDKIIKLTVAFWKKLSSLVAGRSTRNR